MLSEILKKLKHFRRENKGLAAIEFAMLVPILLSLYMGAVEIGQALTVDRKLSSLAGAAGDLVAQSQQIDQTSIDDIFNITNSILSPYDSAGLKITISSVVSDVDNVQSVDWSVSNTGSAHAEGSTIPGMSANVTEPNSSVIVTEVEYAYNSPVTYYITGPLEMSQIFYTRPRKSLQVDFVN